MWKGREPKFGKYNKKYPDDLLPKRVQKKRLAAAQAAADSAE